MKKITMFLILMLCTIVVANAQVDRVAKALGDSRVSQTQNTQSRAVATIYETSFLGANGAEITAAANGAATSMADAIVLAGTNRILQTVTVNVFNLASAAPYNLTLRIYTDCTTNGAAGACGSGPGTLVAASTVTQTVTPGPLGFIYSVVFTLPNVNLYPETDNNISVSLNASRSDVFWILNESPVIGSEPAGEPVGSIVQRCGSIVANNGCARSFGLINNFSMKLEAEAAPVNDLCANAITITGDGTISGTTVFATPDGAPACVTSNTSPGVWYKFTDTSGTGSAVTLSLCGGAAYDSKISVYTGSCGVFTCVTGNDDFCGLQSQVGFTTDGSSTYYVLVHGFSSNTGPFDLNVSGFPIVVIGNAPVIVCPADIIVNNSPGTCGAVVNFSGVAIDTEDGNISANIIATPASGSTFAVGDTTVELSVTDSDGNTSTCSFTVTVNDNEAPVAVCQSITVDLDPVTGTATITGADIDNGSTDNCGIASITLDVSSFNCSNTGANTVIMTVTDNSGNASTCSATVTVQDVTAPEVFCIGGFGVFSESEDFDSGLPSGWSTTVNTGSCNWINSSDMPNGDDFPTLAMLFDDDACGSGATASNVSLVSAVYDLTGASNVFIGYDVAFQESGIQTFTVEVFDGSVWQQVALYEDDLIPNIQTESFDVSAFANAAFQVRWTFDDNNGEWGWGAGVDNFLLTYEATSGGGLDVFLDANGMASINPNDLVTGVNEACGYTITVGGGGGGTMGSLATLFASGNNGSPGGAVYFDVTVGPSDLEVTDIDINTAEPGSFTMDVYTLVGTYVGNEGNPGPWGAAAATASGTGAGLDSPSNAVLASSITLSANTTYGMALVLDGTHGHYYTNGDGSNQNYSNADMSMALGSASNIPFTAPAFSPRVFNGAIHYTTGSGGGGLDFTCADLGENLIEVTVTDDSGNVSTCTAVVNVIDNIAPILVCQDATIELGPDGTATVDPMALLASLPSSYEVMVISGDNQSGSEGFTDFTVGITEAANITFDWDYTSNDPDPGFDGFGYLLNGTYTQLTDPAVGNQSGSAAISVNPGDVFGFRSQTDDNVFGNTETVVSNFLPGFSGQFDPANWNLTLTNSDGDAFFVEIPGGPLSYDACGITILAVDVPTVSCADIGTPITITVFASDASGNIAACTSIITVVDLLAPVLTCPADQTVDPGVGNLFYILPDYIATGEATAIDNCTDPVTNTTQSPAPGTALSDGVYTITMTATDEYGNASTCNFELTVESILGVNQNSLDAGIALYPNPAANVVNLVNKTNISLEKMMIYDINGKLVNHTNLRTMQGEKAIDVSSLAAGVYMVQIIGDNASTVKRLIKE